MSELVTFLLPLLIAAIALRSMFRVETVYEWDAALFYVNGQYRRTLAPGRHWLFAAGRKVEIFTVRQEAQWTTTGLVDVSSEERLPFRVSATIFYKVIEPHVYYVRRSEVLLQKALAAALVETVSTMKLEALLAGRADLGARVADKAAPAAPECEIGHVHVDTVQLPPETRRLFIEIEKARLEGLAALERARGEHASLRSLANAARLLKDNPELANLRLLQAVATSNKGATTVVLGQGSLAGYGASASSGSGAA